MKKVILTFLLAGAVTMVMAQATKTVKGAVIDINGNPLPGAKVEATGGAESTVTDADGTFSLEVSQWLKSLSVTYPGMDKNKMSIKKDNRDLIFTMRETKRYWFVNAVAQSGSDEVGVMGAGIMFGKLSKWGWYGKVVMDFTAFEDFDDSSFGPSISAGVTKRLTKPTYLYLGAGYTNLYEDYYYELENYDAVLFELGAIHRLGNFSLNYGVGVACEAEYFWDFDNIKAKFHFGVGYSF